MKQGSQIISKTRSYQALSDHCTAMSGSTVVAVPLRHAAVCCYSVHTVRVMCDPQITNNHVPKQNYVIDLRNVYCEVFINVCYINFVLLIVSIFRYNKILNMG
jgi:hypothetical protein